MTSHHSSPNHVVWEYFSTLRRLAEAAQTSQSPELCRQNTALTVIMAVTVVEVFLNLFFRVRVSEPRGVEHQDQFLEELGKRISLDKKIRSWPKRILGKTLKLDASPGRELMELKELRNNLVHFTSGHETIDLGDVKIHGLADTSAYDTLSAKQAIHALTVTEDIVQAIFSLAGVDELNLRRSLHAWTGKVPSNIGLQGDTPKAARA